ncbi:hemolysin family protein [Candidatus Woesearchaeota archaeon]|nr:hemolysin family protein [Candidatus Woesearchaeota archaeon]
MIAELILLGILLVLSGFFSGSEIAFFSLSDIKVKKLVDEKKRGAKRLQKLKSQPERLLITLLIGNNIVNIGASALATYLTITTLGNAWVGLAAGLLTLIVLIFGEIAPKAIATKNNESISLFIAAPIGWLMSIFWPAIYFLEKINNAILRSMPKGNEDQPLVSEDELRHIIDVSEQEGSIKRDEKEMIEKIFKLDEIPVRDIAIPRNEITSIDINGSIDKAIHQIQSTGFSRMPVYKDHPDNIIGVVHAKDLLEFSSRNETSINLSKIKQKMIFVPEFMKLDSLIRLFKEKKSHMAIVVDEHGSNMGLVTIEDAIEQIVGDIYDEFDKIENDIIKLNQSTYIMKGDTDIDKFTEVTGIRVRSKEFDTVSGMILDKLERWPVKGQKIKFRRFECVVEKVYKKRVASVKIIIKPEGSSR